MGLDVHIYLVNNRKQVEQEGFWNICKTGWVKDEDDVITYEAPCEVYYARKFWSLYEPISKRLGIENGEFSGPLTKKDIEEMINIATHNKDYFDSFDTVPALCEILCNYDDAINHGMIFIFEGDY